MGKLFKRVLSSQKTTVSVKVAEAVLKEKRDVEKIKKAEAIIKQGEVKKKSSFIQGLGKKVISVQQRIENVRKETRKQTNNIFPGAQKTVMSGDINVFDSANKGKKKGVGILDRIGGFM